MKLTFAQIKGITTGALRIEETEDGIHFYKCTEKQVAGWLALSETLGMRAMTTTGVRLDFHTDSSVLEIGGHGSNLFELHLNGLYVETIPLQQLSETGDTAKFDLSPYRDPRGECRVTVIFPSHAIGVLDGLFLSDGATLRRHSYDTRILFIGDSITQGFDSGRDSMSYAWRLTNMLNAESIIHGVGGGVFHESVFDSIDFDPDTVVIAFGTNDFGRYATYEEMRSHVSAFLGLIAKEYANKEIFVISPIWRGKHLVHPMGDFESARRIVIEEAEQLGLRHVDGMTLVPHLPEFFADEWLHPNASGFSLYAENLIRAMGKIK